MALQECRLNLNQKLKELRPHGTLEFPCAGYSSYYTGRQEDSIPWHWHEEIEMVYVAEGRLELKIPSESFYVETGDAFVINSNVLHYAIAADYCKLHSLVFHPTLILGMKIRFLQKVCTSARILSRIFRLCGFPV